MYMKLKNRLNKILNNRIYREMTGILQDSFGVLLVIYLLLLLVDTIWEKSVSSLLNMNIMMIIVIIFAVIATFTQPEIKEEQERKKPGRKSIVSFVLVGIGGAIIIWYKTNEIGWLSCLVSIIGGAMITLVSLIVMDGNGLKTIKTRVDKINSGKDESGNNPELASREKSQFPH
jgi:amino acid transporter